MLARLFGRKNRAEPIHLECGAGSWFQQEVVGESFHQEAIMAAAAALGNRFKVVLIPEPRNKYDPNAVLVAQPDYGPLGHLPRELAALVADSLLKLLESPSPTILTCHAHVAGGVARSLGVWLNCDLSPYGGPEQPTGSPWNAQPALIRTLDDEARRSRYHRFADKCLSAPLSGERIVITGGLVHWDREECQRLLERLGARCTGSVSAKTTLVVVGEAPGAKLARARALDCRVLTEIEFIDTVLEPACVAWEGVK